MKMESISGNNEQKIKKEEIFYDVDWADLVLNIDLVSLRILDKFYRNGNSIDSKCYVLDYLFRELKGVKVSKKTLLRRCYKLHDLGLLNVVKNTKPLCIWPIPDKEQNVRKMITYAYSRILGEKS